MKKLLLLALITACIGIITPCKAYADVSIGATAWYANWDFDGYDVDPAFLFGPTLSIKLNDTYNLGLIYLYGKFDDVPFEGPFGAMKRHDADLTLNGRLNDYFKLYGGMKFIYMSGIEGFGHYGIGPGLGLSATFPIAGNLFFLANIGVFYLFGTEWSDEYDEYDTNDSGLNTSASLAYYLDPLTLSVGYRYQSVKTSYEYDDSTRQKFHGITFALTFSF